MWRSLALVALLLAACGQPKSEAQKMLEKQMLGENVAGLTVQSLQGKPQPLQPVLRQGKPVVLNVWASWCAPCLEELPSLSRLAARGEYRVIAIATDKDAADVTAYLAHLPGGHAFDTWWDSLGNITGDVLKARALPSSYLIDADGRVRLVAAGPRGWDSPGMAEALARALK